MRPLECPQCHKDAMPVWRGMVLGPATSATCRSCGAKVSVAWSAMFAIVPIILASLIAPLVAPVVAIAIWIAAIVLVFWVYYSLIPLVAKN